MDDISKSLGLYIHIPFCLSKCAYCDFYSSANAKENLVSRYVEAVIKHMCILSPNYKDKTFDTVFIGGGTPSILSLENSQKILTAIKSNFNLTESAEFTIESNPDTLDTEKLNLYKNLGINRLSIGMQSANDCELKILKRTHTEKAFTQAFKLARACGFDNINIDIMYGLPTQTNESFANTLNHVISLNPEHISVYGLQLEENTLLYKTRKNYIFPSEDSETQMNSDALNLLTKAGYNRYEISNYSKKNFECQHNLKYWNACEYLSFGASSHSYIGDTRYSFLKNTKKYIESIEQNELENLTDTTETLSKEDKEKEYISCSDLDLLKAFQKLPLRKFFRAIFQFTKKKYYLL